MGGSYTFAMGIRERLLKKIDDEIGPLERELKAELPDRATRPLNEDVL